MANLRQIVRRSTQTAEPTIIGDVTVTPRLRTLAVRLPFGGFCWSRPTGVTVRRREYVEELPIRDRTRMIQGLCAGALIVAFLVSQIAYSHKKENPR